MRIRSALSPLWPALSVVLLVGCGKPGAKEPSSAGDIHHESMKHEPVAAEPHGTSDIYKAESITCPVSGHTALKSKAVRLTYEGRDIYFCCQDCVDPFKADPAKYMANLDSGKPVSDADSPHPTGHK